MAIKTVAGSVEYDLVRNLAYVKVTHSPSASFSRSVRPAAWKAFIGDMPGVHGFRYNRAAGEEIEALIISTDYTDDARTVCVSTVRMRVVSKQYAQAFTYDGGVQA